MNVQRQPPEALCKKMCSWKFHKIHTKAPVPETFFTLTLLKKRPWYRCFPVNFVKFLKGRIHCEIFLSGHFMKY